MDRNMLRNTVTKRSATTAPPFRGESLDVLRAGDATDIDDWPPAFVEDRDPVRNCRHPRYKRTDNVCGVCSKTIDPTRARMGRNNRKRGGKAELEVARLYGGDKIGPLGGPSDIRGSTYATQVKAHTGAPPAWWFDAQPIRFGTFVREEFVWVCTDVLGNGHLAYAPTRWRGIFDLLEADGRTPRLIERFASRGIRSKDYVIVRRHDEPGDPARFIGTYVAWSGVDWLDRYGKDEAAA